MKTFWNFEKTPAKRGTAVVADSPAFPRYWARELVGERIPVVLVEHQDGSRRYLDNRGGQGWDKVTQGRGGPGWPHGDLNLEEGSFVENTTMDLGTVAYLAYAASSKGKSLATGDSLPAWNDLSENIREAWAASADAVKFSLESEYQ